MQPPIIPFIIGQKFTLIGISSSMANTEKDEIIVASLLDSPTFHPKYTGSSQGSWRFGTFKFPGKRKEFHLDLKTERSLVFAGHGVVQRDWELPRDGHTGFAGNACINLGGSAETIRALITDHNLNPDFTAHDCVMAIPLLGDGPYYSEDEIPVFPEVNSSHAVVQRIRQSQQPAAEPPVAPRLTPREIGLLTDAFA